MKFIYKISLIGLLAVGLWSCGDDGNTVYKMGKITGRVFTQNGTTPVGAAKVQIDVNGDVFLTLSDHNGNFELDAPIGSHDLLIYTGKGNLFRSVVPVTVDEGETTILSTTQARIGQVANLAYIPGAYDKIESIIIDSLGYTATQLSISDLDNPSLLSTFDAIFLNCGKQGALDSAKYAHLSDFAWNGGSLYASDWAVSYYTGDGNFIQDPMGTPQGHTHTSNEYPDKACTPDIGGFISDTILCTKKVGQSGLVTAADIIDPNIQVLLNKLTLDIDYDLGSWEVIQILSSQWQVLIQDNSQGYGALAARLLYMAPNNGGGNGNGGGNNGGNGNGNNGGFVTICHIPPGNPGNPQTITISNNALQAHLAHGCQVGPCQQDGNIFYTTFHNHHQGNVSRDIYNVLQYFIMNL